VPAQLHHRTKELYDIFDKLAGKFSLPPRGKKHFNKSKRGKARDIRSFQWVNKRSLLPEALWLKIVWLL
jgi:hypothetical protein